MLTHASLRIPATTLSEGPSLLKLPESSTHNGAPASTEAEAKVPSMEAPKDPSLDALRLQRAITGYDIQTQQFTMIDNEGKRSLLSRASATESLEKGDIAVPKHLVRDVIGTEGVRPTLKEIVSSLPKGHTFTLGGLRRYKAYNVGTEPGFVPVGASAVALSMYGVVTDGDGLPELSGMVTEGLSGAAAAREQGRPDNLPEDGVLAEPNELFIHWLKHFDGIERFYQQMAPRLLGVEMSDRTRGRVEATSMALIYAVATTRYAFLFPMWEWRRKDETKIKKDAMAAVFEFLTTSVTFGYPGEDPGEGVPIYGAPGLDLDAAMKELSNTDLRGKFPTCITEVQR